MGVPSFYRWLITRYPNTVVNAVEEKATPKGKGGGDEQINTSGKNPNGIEFDNLYLDMNGIIHPCFHPDDHLYPPTTFDEVFKSIFIYIDRLFQIVRPRKLLYLAIDGVAPRAKMNQQRSRRFRTAKDAEIAEAEEERLRKQFELEGKKVLTKSESEVSDSNVITPGTEFMDKLSKALKYYVRLRLSTDPGWKAIKVIFSDANVPGEGEHKIMNFIRLQRNHPGYDPNTRHCLYGQDADLIMLALATHELHFSILREDMIISAQQPSAISSLESSLSKADESSVKSRGWFKNVISNNEAVALVKKPYQFLNIWTLREYLELDLKTTDPPCPIDFERIVDDFICMCFLVGNDFLPHMPTLQIHEGAIDLLMAVYKDEFNSRGGYLVDMQKVGDKKAGYVKLKRIEKFMLSVGNYEDRIFKKRYDLQQCKLKKFLRENADGIDNDQSTVLKEPFVQVPAINKLSLESKALNASPSSTNEKEILQNTKELKQKLKDIIRDQSDIFKQSSFGDKVRFGMHGWRERYYKEKFSADSPIEIERIRKDIVQEYMKGICWVLQYYFSGAPSWTWFYPFHHGPFASDLKGLGKLDIKFKMGAPFKPFDQLMGVLPPRSVKALPNVYWNLMTSEDSVLKDFYPTEFEVDVDGKRFLWQGIVKLNFIKEGLLLLETRKLENKLKDDEIKRNSETHEVMLMNKSHALSSQVLSIKHPSDGTVGKPRVTIDVNASDGTNGFLYPCEDLASTFIHIKGMDDISGDDVMSVLFELPDNHLHIPRLLENVNVPEKTITEDDIVKTPLWHEYEGWTPNVRPQSAQRYKQVVSTDISSTREVWKEGGSGWSACGRGTTFQGSRVNSQSSAGIGAAYPGTMSPGSQYRERGYSEPFFSPRNSQSSSSQYRGTVCSEPSLTRNSPQSSYYRSNQTANSPSYVPTGRGRAGFGSSNIQSNSIGNEFSGVWRGGRGRSSGSGGGSRMGNGSFWASRNVSTEGDDPQHRRTSGERW